MQSTSISPNMRLILPIWGELYVDKINGLSLEWLLSPKNLPLYTKKNKAELIIVTTFADSKNISCMPVLKRIQEYISVEIIIADGCIGGANIYTRMSTYYQIGMEAKTALDKVKGIYVFLTTDNFYSDGAITKAAEILSRGFTSVMIAGLRVKEKAFKRELVGACPNFPSNALANQQLVRLVISNLHEETKLQDWFNKQFANHWPSHINWVVDENLIFTHAFHMHPFATRVVDKTSFKGTIDNGFMRAAGFAPKDCYVVTDSDEIIGVDLTAEEELSLNKLDSADVERVIISTLHMRGKLNSYFFTKEIVWHAKPECIPPKMVRENIDFVVARIHDAHHNWRSLNYYFFRLKYTMAICKGIVKRNVSQIFYFILKVGRKL